jgi:hypothetical protein
MGVKGSPNTLLLSQCSEVTASKIAAPPLRKLAKKHNKPTIRAVCERGAVSR